MEPIEDLLIIFVFFCIMGLVFSYENRQINQFEQRCAAECAPKTSRVTNSCWCEIAPNRYAKVILEGE